MITVMLADDHRLVRAGLVRLLATATDIEVVGEASDGRQAVEQAQTLEPDVILMDLSMPVLDGVEATRQILVTQPLVRIVALTSFADQPKVADMLEAGAVGYLLKDCEPADLLSAIRSAGAGGVPLDPRVAAALLPKRQPTSLADQLSEREREVLLLASRGLANKQIGRSLGIAERTVKAHLGNVFRRIGVSDRTSAALWARDNLPSGPSVN
ncbi:MAG TPA: response regulator transcription factor [Frankiaceae bacterium]|jgi:DNA-binding NarL/FixJ family response regulator|nr:response regulator transcription factor [Frankiaceae bacterium]